MRATQRPVGAPPSGYSADSGTAPCLLRRRRVAAEARGGARPHPGRVGQRTREPSVSAVEGNAQTRRVPLSLFAANERVFDARAEPTRDLRHQRPAPRGLGPHPLGAPAPGTPTRPPADGAEIPSCRPGSAPAAPPSLPSLLGCLSPRRLPPSSCPVVLGLGPKPRCHLWKTTLLSMNIWSPPRILRPSATAPGRGWATRSGQRSISSRRRWSFCAGH